MSTKRTPVTVGSAAAPLQFGEPKPATRASRLPTLRLHPVRPSSGPTHFEPQSEDYLDELIEEDARRARRRRVTWMVGLVVLVLAIVAAAFIGYQWTQSRYFVGASSTGKVAIFQGVQQDLGPISLSHVYEETPVAVNDLPAYDKQLVKQTINADDLTAARSIVEQLSDAVKQ